jgi:hypothetical protein
VVEFVIYQPYTHYHRHITLANYDKLDDKLTVEMFYDCEHKSSYVWFTQTIYNKVAFGGQQW